MIRALLAGLFCLLTLPAVAEVKIQEVTSPGGIKAWLVEEHGIPFTALEVRFRGGTSLDPAGKRGATMLMASLLEEGSGKLDSRGFAEAREALAARFGFDADADAVSVSAQMLTENRDQAAALLHKALTDATFDQPSIDRVKDQIRSIIQSHASDPDQIAGDMAAHALFGDHPYGSSDLGTLDSVGALTRDDVVAARAAALSRDRLFVSAAGDINPADLGKLLDQLFDGLPATGGPQVAEAGPSFDGKVHVAPFDTPQSVVSFAQPGIALTDKDYFAAALLNQIVGGDGFTARLMNQVREKRGLTYGISTHLVVMDHAAYWQGGFASANAKAGGAVKVVRQVWADTAAKGVTDKELKAAKTYMTGSYPLRFDGNDKIAGILVGMQMVGLPSDYVAHRNGLIEAVTLADVNRVARQLMAPDKLSFTVVGHPEGLASDP